MVSSAAARSLGRLARRRRGPGGAAAFQFRLLHVQGDGVGLGVDDDFATMVKVDEEEAPAPAAAPAEKAAEEPAVASGTPPTKRVRHNGFDKHTLKLKIGGKRLEAVDKVLHPELRPAKWRRPLPAGLDLEPIGWEILTAFEDAQSDRRTNDYPYGCNELVKAETAAYRVVTKLRTTGESAGSQDTTVAIKPPLCRRIRCCLLRSRHDIVRAFDRRPPAPEAVQGMEIEDVD